MRSATLTTSLNATPSDGSRSKRQKSGRSGLSTREYHVFRSMQPMFAIQRSASSSFTSGYEIVRFSRVARDTERYVVVGIQSGMWDGASFWKKCLPSIPSGKRFIVNGRFFRCGTSAGATAS